MNKLIFIFVVAAGGSTHIRNDSPSVIEAYASKEYQRLAQLVKDSSADVVKEFESDTSDDLCMYIHLDRFKAVETLARKLTLHRSDDHPLRDAIEAFQKGFENWSMCYRAGRKPGFWNSVQLKLGEMKAKRHTVVDKVAEFYEDERASNDEDVSSGLSEILELLRIFTTRLVHSLRNQGLTCSSSGILKRINQDKKDQEDMFVVERLIIDFGYAVKFMQRDCPGASTDVAGKQSTILSDMIGNFKRRLETKYRDLKKKTLMGF